MSTAATQPHLAHDFASERRRLRILEATARAVCRHGVDGAKVSILVREAGVARKTFYGSFDGKDGCLKQTLTWVGESALERVIASLGPRAIGDTARVRHGLAALLYFAAENPHLVRFYLLAGTSVSLQILEKQQESFAELLAPVITDGLKREMVVGGISSTLRHSLLESPEADPRLLLTGLTDFVRSAFPAARGFEAVA